MFAIFLDQIARCKHNLKRGEILIFNADFNMIFPIIWQQSPNNVPEYKDYGKNLINLMSSFPNEKKGFSLYFTLPSFLELLDSFRHHANNAERLLNSTRTYEEFKKSKIEDLIFNKSSISSETASKELERIKNIASLSHIKQALERAKSLIGNNGVISGLEDLLHQDIHYEHRHVELFSNLYETMNGKRGLNDSRRYDDRSFHYKIDVANIITTIIVNDLSGFDSRFVTHQSLIKTYCPKKGIDAMMPYVWFSSELLCKKHSDTYGDHDFLLRTMNRRVKECLDIVSHYKEGNFPDTYRKVISDFYCDYILPIHGKNHTMPNRNREHAADTEHELTFDSFMDFRNSIEEGRDAIGDSVRELVSEAPFLMDKDTLDVFQLKNDPIVSEIVSKFDLKP